MKTLFPYQKEVFDYAKKQPNVGLFLSMRLGKTLISIKTAIAYGSKKVLVIAPLTVLVDAWARELADANISYVTLRTKNMYLSRVAEGWFLTNYETVRNNPLLLRQHWDTVICDESTRFKNPKALITKVLLKYRDWTDHRIILSGCPCPEGLLDLVTQFIFLTGSFCGISNFWKVRARYFTLDASGYNYLPKKGTQAKFEAYMKEHTYRLTKEMTGMFLPKVYQRRIVTMAPEQRKLYKQCKQDFVLAIPMQERETNWVVTQIQWLCQIAGGVVNGTVVSDTKVKELYTLLTEELHDEQIIVWFRYNEHLRYVSDYLKEKGIQTQSITGKTKVPERKIICDSFNSNKFRILLIQQAVGQFGINLAGANTAIYYNTHYSYEMRAQSEDRVISPTKQIASLIIDIITENSIEEDILNLLQVKKFTSQATMMRELLQCVKKQ